MVSVLRKLIAHLALLRSDDALVAASGGAPRSVRGMVLDPRVQFIEQKARENPFDWEKVTPAHVRARTDALSATFGGGKVGGVRRQRVYVTGRSHSVPCRLYLPRVRDNNAAMLVYYHYGGGVIGTLEDCERLCSLIARVSGAPVLSVEYRLAPEYKFPAGFEDALAAFHWGVENAARFGAAVGKVAVGGDSMGGNFAAAIAQQTRGGRGPKPVLQLLIYPGLDLVSDTASMHEFADAFPLTEDLLAFFLKHYLPDGVDPSDPRVSPGRTQDLSRLPPALIYGAGFDILLDQGEAYADRLTQAGVKTKYVRFDTLPHGFVAFPSMTPAAEAAIRRIAADAAPALKGKL
ncbi:MAG: alpha/beta hydrolase [Hyphomonadaceae bacterium]